MRKPNWPSAKASQNDSLERKLNEAWPELSLVTFTCAPRMVAPDASVTISDRAPVAAVWATNPGAKVIVARRRRGARTMLEVQNNAKKKQPKEAWNDAC
ncbi:MAG: hypothetical protein DMG40_13930 [Acidobacteria bacterium]|nr:MAG: hypothetical protein DMG40_13930 [Acidobacteriota bacterium]